MRKIIPMLALACLGYCLHAQTPANDDCSGAILLDLGTPLACGEANITSFSGSNIGAAPSTIDPSIILQYCIDDIAIAENRSDVWYYFVAPASNLTFEIVGLEGASLFVFSTNDDCSSLEASMDCLEASTQDYTRAKITTHPGENLYLFVSGTAGAESDFVINILSDEYDCSPCYEEDKVSFVANPAPVLGRYEAGQEVQFCFTVNKWDGLSADLEWLHALTLELGAGWESATFSSNPPISCDQAGAWGYYDNWTSCSSGKTFGPGFAYDSSIGVKCEGVVNDGNPGNNHGDGAPTDNGICMQIGEEVSPITFCWNVRVRASVAAIEQTDLSIQATVWSDGDSGSWWNPGCNSGMKYGLLATSSEPYVHPTEITTDLSFACANEPVTYQLQNPPADAEYMWVLPGSSSMTSTEEMPTVTYSETGEYGASLLLTTPAGTETYANLGLVQVSESDPLEFVVENVNGSGDIIAYTLTGPYTNIRWDVGDGSSYSGDSLQYTFSDAGTYTISLSAENGCGIQETSQQLIIQLPPPTPAFSTKVIEDCNPAVIEFRATSATLNLDHLWLFPGGEPASSTDPIVSVTYAQVGTYDVSLRLSNDSGSNQKLFEDAVHISVVAPSADFDFTTEEGLAKVYFTNLSQGADQYSWDFGDGTGSTLANPVHDFPASGFYEVSLLIVNNCNEDLITKTVEVRLPPVSGITADYSNTCGPATVSFEAVDQANSNTYFWIFPGGHPFMSSEANVEVQYLSPGTYPVYYGVTNNAGEWSRLFTDYVVLAEEPEADFEFNITPASSQINFNYTGNYADSYSWDFGDGQGSNLQNPNYTYAQPGTYTVSLTISNACGVASVSKEVRVDFNPVNTVSVNPSSGCSPLTVTYTADNTSSDTELSWIFPGGTPFTASGNSVSVTYHQPGEYAYFLNINSPVGYYFISDPAAVSVQQCLTLEGPGEQNVITSLSDASFKVYPNPVGNQVLYLQTQDLAEATTLQLSWIDVNGRLVLQEKIDVSLDQTVLALQQKPKARGVYWLRIDWETGPEEPSRRKATRGLRVVIGQ